MKKLTPFIFPLLVLGIVLFLLFRWYQMRTAGVDEQLSFGEGIEIEDLSGDELQSVLSGSEDVKTVELESESDEQAASGGVIRYEVIEDKVAFSVITSLSDLPEGEYQVWLRDPDTQEVKKAFVLETGKGGYVGSAAVSVDLLPFDVIVTKQMAGSEEMGEVVLRAQLDAPMDEESEDEASEAESTGETEEGTETE